MEAPRATGLPDIPGPVFALDGDLGDDKGKGGRGCQGHQLHRPDEEHAIPLGTSLPEGAEAATRGPGEALSWHTAAQRVR